MPQILLVDDDEPVRRMLRIMLEQSNCTVTEVSSGEAATHSMAQICPDVLITDIIMPGLAGLDVISAVRHMNQAVKIIAISGAGRVVKTEYLKMAVALGADAVLEKPFSREQLVATLERLLGPWPNLPPAQLKPE